MGHFSRLLDPSTPPIQCRHCGAVEDDDYEVVEENTVHSLRCAGCGSVTHIAVFDCSACGAETLFQWGSPPASEDIRDLLCAACERRYFNEAADPLPFA